MTTRLQTVQIGMTAEPGSLGGVDRYYFALTRALPQWNVAVRGLVVGDEASLAAHTGMFAYADASASMLERWRGLRRVAPPLIRTSDLLVSHFAGFAFPLLPSTFRVPLVTHFHGPWDLEGRAEGGSALKARSRWLLERSVYARSARFIVLSDAFANLLERHYGIAREKIDLVPGGVDLEKFHVDSTKAEARERLGLPTDRPIVVTVRRLVHAKGIENLIDATADVRRRHPDVLVIIAGSGPLRAELQDRIDARGLATNVRLAGFVPDHDLPYLYRAADLSIVPTVALEGFGLIVVESLACGTPALVTPIEGLPEVVRDLDPALILEGARTADLAAGLSRALDDPAALPSEAACIAYARRFDWSKIAGDIAAVYRRAVR